MDTREQHQSGHGPHFESRPCRSQKRRSVALHMFGLLLAMFFVVTLQVTTAVATKVSVSAGGQIRPSNTSLRNIEHENGKQLQELCGGSLSPSATVLYIQWESYFILESVIFNLTSREWVYIADFCYILMVSKAVATKR